MGFYTIIFSRENNRKELILSHRQEYLPHPWAHLPIHARPHPPQATSSHQTPDSPARFLSTARTRHAVSRPCILRGSRMQSSMTSTTWIASHKLRAAWQSLDLPAPRKGVSTTARSLTAPWVYDLRLVIIPNDPSKKKKHERLVHRKEGNHGCDRCPKRFGEKRSLIDHVDSVHKKLKPHACTFTGCRARFGQKSHLTTHIKKKHWGQIIHLFAVSSFPFYPNVFTIQVWRPRARGGTNHVRKRKWHACGTFYIVNNCAVKLCVVEGTSSQGTDYEGGQISFDDVSWLCYERAIKSMHFRKYSITDPTTYLKLFARLFWMPFMGCHILKISPYPARMENVCGTSVTSISSPQMIRCSRFCSARPWRLSRDALDDAIGLSEHCPRWTPPSQGRSIGWRPRSARRAGSAMPYCASSRATWNNATKRGSKSWYTTSVRTLRPTPRPTTSRAAAPRRGRRGARAATCRLPHLHVLILLCRPGRLASLVCCRRGRHCGRHEVVRFRGSTCYSPWDARVKLHTCCSWWCGIRVYASWATFPFPISWWKHFLSLVLTIVTNMSKTHGRRAWFPIGALLRSNKSQGEGEARPAAERRLVLTILTIRTTTRGRRA